MTHSDDPPYDLDVFLERYDRDGNEWWRLDGGDQLNLFDALREDRDGWRDQIMMIRAQQRAALARAEQAEAQLRDSARDLADAAGMPVAEAEEYTGSAVRQHDKSLGDWADGLREGFRGASLAKALNHMTCHAATVSGAPTLPPDFLPNSLGAYPSQTVCDWGGCPVGGDADAIGRCFLAKQPDKS